MGGGCTPAARFLGRPLDGGKGHVCSGGALLFAPLVEQPSIAQRDVFFPIDAYPGGGAVDPFGRAFQLGVVADGRFVHHAMALAVGPLGAPFFIAEGGHQAEGEKNLLQRRAVGDFGLGLDAVLVACLRQAESGRRLWVTVQRPA